MYVKMLSPRQHYSRSSSNPTFPPPSLPNLPPPSYRVHHLSRHLCTHSHSFVPSHFPHLPDHHPTTLLTSSRSPLCITPQQPLNPPFLTSLNTSIIPSPSLNSLPIDISTYHPPLDHFLPCPRPPPHLRQAPPCSPHRAPPPFNLPSPPRLCPQGSPKMPTTASTTFSQPPRIISQTLQHPISSAKTPRPRFHYNEYRQPVFVLQST